MTRCRPAFWALGLAILMSCVMAALGNITKTVPALAMMEALPTIILDPGHGGMDGGAVGVDNIVEKGINLDIALVLRDMLTASGFTVVMTREMDISLHDEGILGARKQKTSDLHNRLALTEQYPRTIFISIHQNKFGGAANEGAQMFYGPRQEESRQLAEILQKNMVSFIQPNNTRQIKKANKNLFLMVNASCPAVLIECGFLSSPREAKLLIDPAYQKQIAFVIGGSLLEFLQVEAPSDGVLVS